MPRKNPRIGKLRQTFWGLCEVKKKYANETFSPLQFQTIKIANAKSVATSFYSSETMCWVTEVFEGLPSQYEEYKYGKRGLQAGYKNYIGNDLIGLFLKNRNSKQRITAKQENIL